MIWRYLPFVVLFLIACTPELSPTSEPPPYPTSEVWTQMRANPELCATQTTRRNKDLCYWDHVWKVEQLYLCDNISERAKKADCYKHVGVKANDVTICQKYSTTESLNECYWSVAGKTKDPGLCAKISVRIGRTQVQISQDSCYRNVAAGLQDPSLCNKVQDKQYCLKNVELAKGAQR